MDTSILFYFWNLFFLLFFPYLSCCETLNGIWGLWASELHHSINKSVNLSAPCGTTAAKAWYAQTAEVLRGELNNLGVSGNGQIPLLTSRLVYLLAWIKLSLREEMWLSSLRSHVPAVLVCGHESDGRKPDWLGVVRCCNSGDVFTAGLAFVPPLPLPPNHAQEKISSHSPVVSSVGCGPRHLGCALVYHVSQ